MQLAQFSCTAARLRRRHITPVIPQEDVGWIAGRFPEQKQLLAFSGADPAVIQAGLQELMNAPHMAAIGGFAVSGAVAPAGSAGQAPAPAESVVPREAQGGALLQPSPVRRLSNHMEDQRTEELRSLALLEHAPTPTSTPTPAAAAAAAAVAAVAGAVAAGTSPIAPVPHRRGQPVAGVAGGEASEVKPEGAAGGAYGAQRGSGTSFAARVRLSRENQLYGAWCRHAIGGVGGGFRR